MELETDRRRLDQRQKQITFGLATPGFANYSAWLRVHGPQNVEIIPIPNIHMKCSKRMWDLQMRNWRRELHRWDPIVPVVTSSPIRSEYAPCANNTSLLDQSGSSGASGENASPGYLQSPPLEPNANIGRTPFRGSSHVSPPPAARASSPSSFLNFSSPPPHNMPSPPPPPPNNNRLWTPASPPMQGVDNFSPSFHNFGPPVDLLTTTPFSPPNPPPGFVSPQRQMTAQQQQQNPFPYQLPNLYQQHQQQQQQNPTLQRCDAMQQQQQQQQQIPFVPFPRANDSQQQFFQFHPPACQNQQMVPPTVIHLLPTPQNPQQAPHQHHPNYPWSLSCPPLETAAATVSHVDRRRRDNNVFPTINRAASPSVSSVRCMSGRICDARLALLHDQEECARGMVYNEETQERNRFLYESFLKVLHTAAYLENERDLLAQSLHAIAQDRNTKSNCQAHTQPCLDPSMSVADRELEAFLPPSLADSSSLFAVSPNNRASSSAFTGSKGFASLTDISRAIAPTDFSPDRPVGQNTEYQDGNRTSTHSSTLPVPPPTPISTTTSPSFSNFAFAGTPKQSTNYTNRSPIPTSMRSPFSDQSPASYCFARTSPDHLQTDTMFWGGSVPSSIVYQRNADTFFGSAEAPTCQPVPSIDPAESANLNTGLRADKSHAFTVPFFTPPSITSPRVCGVYSTATTHSFDGVPHSSEDDPTTDGGIDNDLAEALHRILRQYEEELGRQETDDLIR